MSINPLKKDRLLSLDVLRGITIAGMILVNNAGACGFGYSPLSHVKWDGFNPADLVFPMFMFVMGVSIYISLKKNNFDWHYSLFKVLKRTFLIILCGLALKWVLNSMDSGNWLDFSHMRFMGVLQRLGICYGIVALMALFIRHKYFPWIAGGLLLIYFTLQIIGNGFIKSADNIASIVDNALLGANHMYLHGKQFVDPEGVLSTIPAVAQVMIGFLCGKIIIENKENDKRMILLFVLGNILLILGYLWSYATPINKRLWSPSFVLITCGSSSLIFATLIYFIDVKGYKKWSKFFQIFGVNPLVLYILSEVLGDAFRIYNITDISFNYLWQPVFGNYMGSCMYAIVFVFINWIVGYILYKKQIWIKL